ncbi:MAG: MFS transporter, partial [Clostridia bacterium]|nr:MFS transporter [Clostridia bacterium]
MEKIKSKRGLILYGCSGLGVNMLNIIVGSYLCSALLVGGFDKHVESWTYLNKDLVVAGLWAVLVFLAKALDGIIDLPLAAFADNVKSKLGRRKTTILLGIVPMLVAYGLFLVPINQEATIANTIWFGVLLCVFYTCYTLTMLTYYATFSEVCQTQKDMVTLSNTKSICDVVYYSLGFALVPVFVSMGVNIRVVALIFLPLVATMIIPFLLL